MLYTHLKTFHKQIHVYIDHVNSAATFISCYAVIDPPFRSKICRLCTIEAVVESGMIAVRKGDHELAGLLSYLNRKQKLRVPW